MKILFSPPIPKFLRFWFILIFLAPGICSANTVYVADYGFGYIGQGPTEIEACSNLVTVLNNSIDFDGIQFESVINSIAGVDSPCGDDYLSVIYPACKMGNGEPVNSPGYCTGYASIRSYTTPTDTYMIKIEPLFGQPLSDTLLGEVEPETGENTIPLVAKVFDGNGDFVSDTEIRIEPHVIAFSGGHNHDDLSRDKDFPGELTGIQADNNAIIGNTGSTGYIFTFSAPAPAGSHILLASCIDIECPQSGADRIFVGFSGLEELDDPVDPKGDLLYSLIGETTTHPKNHYLKQNNVYKALIIASIYRNMHPGSPILRYNDGSIQWGGRFDVSPVNHPWLAPHVTHRNGEDLDVRANPEVNPGTAIPEDNFDSFREIVNIVGASASIHSKGSSNQHFHINF
jgi:hypothetical protein